MNDIFLLNLPSAYIRVVSHYAVVKVFELLEAKGLKAEVALQRAHDVFGEELEKVSLYMHNLQTSFEKEVMEEIYRYLANKALFQDVVSLRDYDSLVGMMSQVQHKSMNTQDLEKLSQISKANRYAFALA